MTRLGVWHGLELKLRLFKLVKVNPMQFEIRFSCLSEPILEGLAQLYS